MKILLHAHQWAQQAAWALHRVMILDSRQMKTDGTHANCNILRRQNQRPTVFNSLHRFRKQIQKIHPVPFKESWSFFFCTVTLTCFKPLAIDILDQEQNRCVQHCVLQHILDVENQFVLRILLVSTSSTRNILIPMIAGKMGMLLPFFLPFTDSSF